MKRLKTMASRRRDRPRFLRSSCPSCPSCFSFLSCLARHCYGIALLLVGACVLCWLARDWFRDHALGINVSASATPGVYYLSPLPALPSLNQQVTFSLKQAGWLMGRGYWGAHDQLIKTIAAVPGQYLFHQHKRIWVCDHAVMDAQCRELGRCLSHDTQGRVVACVDWHGEKIPAGYYYLMSQRVVNALDSRYLGLISREQLTHQARLVWAI